MKATGRAKSSIHTHIKDIPLSKERVRQYKAASGERIRKFALARKGKSARAFKTFDEWSVDSVLLIAHLLFDGEIARTRCAYNNRSTALIERVEQLMHEWYDFEPSRYYNKMTGVSRITYNNVALSSYLHTKSKELLRLVRSMSLDCKREFLRAFFDDEGCIDYRPEENRRSIRGYQKDVGILKLIRAILVEVCIDSHVVKPNEVVIVGKENLMRFEQEINFSSGVYMNGNRSNSRWKKHIEKRELLKQAIKSFKS
ncbi:MAG: LAGLIDADG family homing endonuclease [Candidatus Kaiserbacteria bacterium]|nr:LAGLIDADG family homing endonuclease [Candidatus Kaiserbacteria bacterium]